VNIDNEDRVFRGGSWYLTTWFCRASCRLRLAPSYRVNSLGFRVVHRRKA